MSKQINTGFCSKKKKKTMQDRGVSYRLLQAPHVLIGVKRYGGYYCTRCEVSLLRDGEESARLAAKVHVPNCPLCNAPVPEQTQASAAAATSSNAPNEKSVVAPCSCFDWHMAPHRLQQRNMRDMTVVDGFDRQFSVSFFLNTIVHAACPIQLYDNIAQ